MICRVYTTFIRFSTVHFRFYVPCTPYTINLALDYENICSYNVQVRRVFKMVRRTKKEFKPYNDYVDRPFELKWPTAFPLGELQAAIKETNDYHSREIERLPQQSQAKIEHLLSRSIKQNSAEFLR